MSKRNFILLITVLVLAVSGVFVFWSSRPTGTAPTDSGTGTNFFSQFNPFGTKPTPPAVTPPTDVSGYVPPSSGETADAKLLKVSSMPIAGFGLFSKERIKETTPQSLPLSGEEDSIPPAKGGSGGLKKPLTEFKTAVRYVAKATGNIYQTFADKIEEKKFSVTTIPKVYDSYFGNRDESVVMRYLKADNKTIETFVGNLPKEYLGTDPNTNNEIKGSFLPDNVKDISISPDTLKMFYLFESGNNMIGTTLNFSDNKKVQVFDSPFTEWLSQWGSSNTIILATKPSGGIPGYVYSLDLVKKNLTKIFGEINGLTTLGSSNGRLILFGDSNLLLNIYHTDSRNSDILGVRTLPEKCVWGKISDAVYCAVPKLIIPNIYPDSWYQGEVSFNDQLWKIDIKTGNATLILNPTTVVGGEEVDGIKLALDEGENYLFFINKKDSFLWGLELK